MTAQMQLPLEARPLPATSNLCTECHARPRAAGGRLLRCLPCLQAEAERGRQERAARAKKSAEAKPLQVATDPVIRAEIEKLKACRACKEAKPLKEFGKHGRSKDGYRYDCRDCIGDGKKPTEASHVAHRRRVNRIAVKNWSERNSAAVHARARLRRAVRKGVVKPASQCEAEGCTAGYRLHGHHHDHAKPLAVCWLCPRHHRRLHTGGRIRLKPPRPQELAGIPDDLA
jgi:hypothetical protein